MRINRLVMMLACLVFLGFGQAYADMIVHAESPQAAGGSIPLNTDFTVDIWIDMINIDNGGGSFSFGFRGTAGLTEVQHVTVSGGDLSFPSVQYLNNFATYFGPGLIFPAGNGFDGSLPDSINFSFLTFGAGLPASNPDQPYIRFNMRSAQNGILCMDSITHQDIPDWDWLFPVDLNPITFNGPYCFTIGTPIVNNPPEISCPDNAAVEVGANIQRTVTATDPDAGDEVTISAENLPTGATFLNGVFNWTPTCDQDGQFTITFIADDGEATDQCDWVLTINPDNTDPVVTCPANIVVSNDLAMCGAVVNFEIDATDNCGVPSVVANPPSGTFFEPGVTTVNVLATDASGNTAACSFTVTVNDTEDPTITCPSDVVISCSSTLDPVLTGYAYATDNCAAGLEVTYSDVETPGSCPQEKIITRNWSAVDAAGNIAACAQTITVVDEIAPVITCPDDITVPFGSSTEPSATGFATATDDCDPAPAVTYADVANTTVITRTWTAADACGNSVQCVQTITIQGSGAPIIDCPDDITVSCNSATDPSVTGTATAVDDNDPEPAISYSDEETPGSCPFEKTIARTWRAEDDDANFSTCVQTIIVIDEAAPVLTCPDDINIDCAASTDPSQTGVATAVDNCDSAPVVAYTDAVDGVVITRTWTATDACGNVGQCIQTITLIDETAPEITSCPADIGLSCEDPTDYEHTGMPTATDNCDLSPAISFSEEITYGDCPQNYVITRTFYAVDDAGNSAQCVQIISVADETSPVLTCPEDVTVIFGGDTSPDATGFATAVDLCDEDVAVSYSDEVTEDLIVRVWTAVDECGNQIQCNQNITLLPMPDPILEVDPTIFNLTVVEGGSITGQMLHVSETYDRNIAFTAANKTAWLTFTNTFPLMTPNTLFFDIDASLITGWGLYVDTITITSNDAVNSPLDVYVMLNITPAVVPPDSVWVSTVPGVTGNHVMVPVYFKNNDDLTRINIPLEWGSSGLILDSVSFVGTRVHGVDNKYFVHDNGTRKVLVVVDPVFSDPVEPGRGLLAKLYFAINPFLPPTFIEIDQTTIPPDNYLFFEDEFSDRIIPVFTPGGIVVDDQSGFVCGRVIDTDGNEIEGATVELWDDFPAGGLMTTQISDINGQFACGTLGVFPFDAYAHKEGYYPGLMEEIEFGQIGFDIVLRPVDPVHESPFWVQFFSGETCVSFFQNVPLPAGTVVDAFTPEGLHVGTIYVTIPGEFSMEVYGDDPRTPEVKDGAEPGDMISFFINGYPANVVGNNFWTEAGEMVEVCLDLFTVNTVTIDLAEGWNLISWNVDTPEDDIETLFGDIMGDVEVILGFEQGGFTYDPSLPDFSTLGNCDHLHGFWVKMYNPATLTITGSPVAATTPIGLEAGWNLVSYLPDSEFEPAYALGGIIDHMDVVTGWRNGGPESYDPDLPEYSGLEFMRPTFGYWINMMMDMDLVYPGVGPLMSFGQFLAKMDPAVSHNEVSTSRLWVDLYSHRLTLDGQMVATGSEILAVANDGKIIGAGTVTNGGRFGFMPVYGNDPLSEKVEGPADGGKFHLVIDGIETAEQFTWSGQNRTLEIGALTARVGGDASLLPDRFGLTQNYPNPFNPTTSLSFAVPTSGQVTLEVYNVLGEKVTVLFDGVAQAGITTVIWNGRNDRGVSVASGIYFARLKAGDFAQSRKMVLMK